MNVWTATHHHKYGQDVLVFDFMPTEDEVKEFIDFDNSEDSEEYIDIVPAEVIHFKKADIGATGGAA